jgi:hypothetical protein
MIRFLTAVALIGAILSSPAAADGPPPPLPPSAVRLDLALLVAEPAATAPPTPGDCSSFYDIAVEAGWTDAEWPNLRVVLDRETWHCHPERINRYGCSGLLQVCPVNQRRLGVTRWDLQDPLTNLRIGRTLFEERRWRPWWTRHWRPR